MRVLVTGASGFIGSRLTQKLSNLGIEFDVVKRVSWPEDILNLNLSGYRAVLHLATARVTDRSNVEQLRSCNVLALKNLLVRIKTTNPRCGIVFVSSQSAKPNTSSLYGQLKWECEELLRGHNGPWTILRPGLVIGPGGRGLGNTILSLARRFPLVPLVGRGDQLIQPVAVDTVVDALIGVAQNVEDHCGKVYAVAGETLSFKEFLREAAAVAGRSIRFIAVPMPLISLGLSILACLQEPPLTHANLLGLLDLEPLDSTEARNTLGLSFPALREILAACADVPIPLSLKEEAEYLHRALFGSQPSDSLQDRYVRAHQYCCFAESSAQHIDIPKIVHERLDPEAIEYATRSQRTVLTKKTLLLSYLAEVQSSHYEYFVNVDRSLFWGLVMVALAVLRTPFKFAKGKYLVWRYELV